MAERREGRRLVELSIVQRANGPKFTRGNARVRRQERVQVSAELKRGRKKELRQGGKEGRREAGKNSNEGKLGLKVG